ncbi:MAG: Double zinc ribbon and ankyrin repeat-containing protein 1, partial [Paramarteilia canceri]
MSNLDLCSCNKNSLKKAASPKNVPNPIITAMVELDENSLPTFSNRICTNTQIVIESMEGFDIFYSLRIKKGQQDIEKKPVKYLSSFTLLPGKITIKSWCINRKTNKASATVSKTYQVHLPFQQKKNFDKSKNSISNSKKSMNIPVEVRNFAVQCKFLVENPKTISEISQTSNELETVKNFRDQETQTDAMSTSSKIKNDIDTQCEPLDETVKSVQTDCKIKPDEITGNIDLVREKIMKSSPGNGFWRSQQDILLLKLQIYYSAKLFIISLFKQVDYICKCLKILTNEDAQFRSSISNLHLGKLFETNIGNNGDKIEILLRFEKPTRHTLKGSDSTMIKINNKIQNENLAKIKMKYISKNAKTKMEKLKSFSEKSSDSFSSQNPNLFSDYCRKEKKLVEIFKKTSKNSIVDSENKELVDELRDCDKDENFRWLYKDSCSGTPLLFYALRSRSRYSVEMCIKRISHQDLLQIRCDLTGNTILHEAVIYGCDEDVSLFCKLLELGCSAKRKNFRQETAETLIRRLSLHNFAKELAKYNAKIMAFGH